MSADLPITPEEMDRLTDFHVNLLRWVSLTQATKVREEKSIARFDKLLADHAALYDVFYKTALDPEYVLRRFQPNSHRVKLFKDSIDEAKERNSYDQVTSSPQIFKAGLCNFLARCSNCPREPFRTLPEEIHKEIKEQIISLKASKAEEEKEKAISYFRHYNINWPALFNCLSDATENTACAGAQNDKKVIYSLAKLAATSAFEKSHISPKDRPRKKARFEEWLKTQWNIPIVGVDESPENALSQLDETLIAYSDTAIDPTIRRGQLQSINDRLREALREMGVKNMGLV